MQLQHAFIRWDLFILACDRLNSTAYHRCVRCVMKQRDHISSNLRQLHWWPIAERVTQALHCRPERSSWTSAGLHYFSQPPPLHRGPRCEPRTVETMSYHGLTEDSQIKHFPLLHDGRGTNCRLILQEAQLSQRGRAMLRVCL